MQPDLNWLDDPEVFRVHQMAAHSDHPFYATEEELNTGVSSLTLSLNGNWDFFYAPCPAMAPADFFREDEDTGPFVPIAVPGHIELSGFSQIQYVNTMYPWEGHVLRRPPGVRPEQPAGVGSFARTALNPTGCYRRVFDLPPAMAGKRISVYFEGVEGAMYLWLNGTFVGYSEDSFTPSEFDLTPYIREKGNVLALRVHKFSTASYLEDQDFFRFFGIFRNVTLVARPQKHIEDLTLSPLLLADQSTGILNIQARLSGTEPGDTLLVTLKDPGGQTIVEAPCPARADFSFSSGPLASVLPWDHRNPRLYSLTLRLLDRGGSLSELVPWSVGFRRLEVREQRIFLNGRPLRLLGVNRHEWSPRTGRSITRAHMEADLRIFHSLHINAVRTSHYPNQALWYSLCDREGIYVMAETNLESHGSWQTAAGIDPTWNVPGSSPRWQEAVVDRARSNYALLKNHPSILFWSLGNESYAGSCLEAMDHFFHACGDGRLTHYEGVSVCRRFAASVSDVESRMYASPEEAAAYLENRPQKPFLLCEFMHSMGNSLGGLGQYMALFDRFPSFCGGFLWDFIDQALWVTDPVTGKEVLRYGGDFDDRPTDYAFSGDGILFADRTEKPCAQEVRYYYGKYEA